MAGSDSGVGDRSAPAETSTVDEFRVRTRVTERSRQRLVGMLVPTAILLAIVLFGYANPKAGYLTISLILTPPTLLLLWRFTAFVRGPLRNATVFLATPTGFTVGRYLAEPWSGITAISIGVHTTIRAQYGHESTGHYRLLLSVHRTELDGRRRRPVRRFYRRSYDLSWQELFAYIGRVAPHVRLIDRRDTDLATLEQRRHR